MEGLEIFREAFEAYSDNYVIIGGTACDITMTGTTVRPRATHDIDMIVVVEKMTADFAERFWQFIREGGYRPEKRKQEEGETPKYELYRFVNGKPDYPEMIELLSRHPDILGEPKGLIVEPLLVDEETSSLSAIIMDDDFYHFTIQHSKLTNGLRHAAYCDSKDGCFDYICSSAFYNSAFNSFTLGTFFLQSFLDTLAYSSPIPLMIFIISLRTSFGWSTSI